VCAEDSSKIAAVPSNSGPVPNARTWPTAPGRLVTHRATVSIQSMPAPISFQNTASKPNGMASRPRMPIGITSVDTTGMASRLAIIP
jgi:hypothetical protein